MAWWSSSYWRPYVPVEKRRSQALRKLKELEKKGHKSDPVVVEGRAISRTFWGNSWCENLERYSDFANRLPRGRTYVRNGSVIDLQVNAGTVKALVSGSEIYSVKIDFAAASRAQWQSLKEACAGKIDSVIELLQGRFSEGVMEVLTARESGLFPAPAEIAMECSCPDYATMCKHVAAVLYGVGARLDSRPELLFVLRSVDHAELVAQAAGAAIAGAEDEKSMDAAAMEQIFGIEIDAGAPARARPVRPAIDSAVRHGLDRKAAARRGTRAKAGAPKIGARKAAGLKVDARRPDALATRVRELRDFFSACDTLTNTQYREIFAVSATLATRELGRLVERGVLIQRGQKRGRHYLVGVELW